MIRIVRPAAQAGNLPGGQALVDALEARRLADPADGASKKRAFEFVKGVYGPAPVKRALRAAQHDKCCYCEADFTGNSWGDVEHFRPKTCVQQDLGWPVVYPGYYWLAYRWENLLFSCDVCNRSGKKSLFPLADPAARATDEDGLNLESPLLVDPSAEDPRAHIRFEGEMPIGQGARGDATIRILKLDRGDLRVARLRHLKHLKALLDLATLPDLAGTEERRMNSIEALREAALPTEPFSSMALDFLERNGWQGGIPPANVPQA